MTIPGSIRQPVHTLQKRIPRGLVSGQRNAARIWGDIDGGESAKVGKFTREYTDDIQKIAALPETNHWTTQMRKTAAAFLTLAGV